MAQIPFERVLDYQRLPIDAQDVVTKARIVVAGQPASSAGDDFEYAEDGIGDAPLPAYYPRPIVIEYEHPEHATYQAERSFALPKGVDPFLPPTHPDIRNPILSGGWTGSAANLRDDDPSSYVEYQPGNPAQVAEIAFDAVSDALPRMVGARVSYSLELEDKAAFSPALLQFWIGDKLRFGGGSRTMYLRQALKQADGAVVTFVSLRNAQASISGNLGTLVVRRWKAAPGDMPAVVSLKIHEAYPLVLDRPLLESIARAQIRLPVSTPRRVTVRGYLPPGDLTHTITGWPGGDYTGVVARQSYREGNTIVDFEQAGAPPGVPQDALEAERVRTNRTRELVRAATYPTLVGNHVTR